MVELYEFTKERFLNRNQEHFVGSIWGKYLCEHTGDCPKLKLAMMEGKDGVPLRKLGSTHLSLLRDGAKILGLRSEPCGTCRPGTPPREDEPPVTCRGMVDQPPPERPEIDRVVIDRVPLVRTLSQRQIDQALGVSPMTIWLWRKEENMRGVIVKPNGERNAISYAPLPVLNWLAENRPKYVERFQEWLIANLASNEWEWLKANFQKAEQA